MDSVKVPVPAERTAEFFGLYANWLAAPAGATWTCQPPPAPDRKPWNAAADGETAAAFWTGLSDSQPSLVEVVCRGPIECDQLAVAAGLAGPVATVQEIAKVNTVAAEQGRTDVVLVTLVDERLMVDVDAAAKEALARRP